MGVTVVRGVATSKSSTSGASPSTGSSSSASVSGSGLVHANSAALASASSLAQATQIVSSEAAISHIRGTKFSNSTEKLRDYSEANSSASEIADRIKGEGEALAAHADIDVKSAQEHLSG